VARNTDTESTVKLISIFSNLILTAFVFFSTANASTFQDHLVQIDEIVDGHQVSDYANRWWQWASSVPPHLSPVRDLTGENCHIGQSGDVWFLAGGYGSSTISRECTVPAGKHLFFPVINMIYFANYENAITCSRAKSLAALNNDTVLDIYIELDGSSAWNPADTRIGTQECFDLYGLVPPEYNAPRIYPAATDGYWVMLKPLKRGTHTLSFRAMYNRENAAYGKMAQDIEYVLHVE